MITSVSGYVCRRAAPSAAGFRQRARRGTGRGCRPRGPRVPPRAGTCARSSSVRAAAGSLSEHRAPPREGPRLAGRRISASYRSQDHNRVASPAPRERAPPDTRVMRKVPTPSVPIWCRFTPRRLLAPRRAPLRTPTT